MVHGNMHCALKGYLIFNLSNILTSNLLTISLTAEQIIVKHLSNWPTDINLSDTRQSNEAIKWFDVILTVHRR